MTLYRKGKKRKDTSKLNTDMWCLAGPHKTHWLTSCRLLLKHWLIYSHTYFCHLWYWFFTLHCIFPSNKGWDSCSNCLSSFLLSSEENQGLASSILLGEGIHQPQAYPPLPLWSSHPNPEQFLSHFLCPYIVTEMDLAYSESKTTFPSGPPHCLPRIDGIRNSWFN